MPFFQVKFKHPKIILDQCLLPKKTFWDLLQLPNRLCGIISTLAFSWNIVWFWILNLRQFRHFELGSLIRKGYKQLSLSLDTKVRLSCQNFPFMSSSLRFQSTRYVMLHDGKSHMPFVLDHAHNMYCSIMVESNMPANKVTLYLNIRLILNSIFLNHSVML